MAYIPITNDQVDPDSPVTAELMTALRDNPIGIANGDVGAPPVQPQAIPHMWTAGAVGSLAWATRIVGTAAVAYGATIAGSNIAPTGAFKGVDNLQSNIEYNLTAGSALSGTWRCLGYYSNSGGAVTGATLFIRIS